MTALNISVAVDADDGYSREGTQWGGGDTEIHVGRLDNYAWDGFFRFVNVTIPQGATIDSAILRIVASTTRAVDTALTDLVGEDADNATAPTDWDDWVGRARTSARVAWDNIPQWTSGTAYDSVDMSSVIQEIVDRAGWASGQALNIFWEDDGSSEGALRDGSSHEHATHAPVELRVTYTAPAPGGYAAVF